MLTLAAVGDVAYKDQSTMTPLAAAIIMSFCAVILSGNRSHALGALLAIVCFIPAAQRIAIFGLDFDPVRMLIVAGSIRVMLRGELATVKTRSVDRVFAAYVFVAWLNYCVLYRFAASAIIYRCGEMFTIIGMYVLCRCLLRTREDVERLAKVMAVLALPVALFFVVEWSTRRNIFSAFGGVSAITAMREGKLRCQGAFDHPILAGCFWAGVLPLAASLHWKKPRSSFLAISGSVASMVIVASTGSSTPIMMVLVILLMAMIYPIRKLLPVFISAFVALTMVRWALTGNPPWHLLARIDLVGGSTGWHRYALIDQAIRRFPEWCLNGTRSTAHWGYFLADVTNHYILEGARGGFLTMVLYITIIVLAYRSLARSLRNHRADSSKCIFSWFFVCALTGHAVGFLAVAYWGPVLMIYWSTIVATFALDDESSFAGHYIIEWDEGDVAVGDGQLQYRTGDASGNVLFDGE